MVMDKRSEIYNIVVFWKTTILFFMYIYSIESVGKYIYIFGRFSLKTVHKSLRTGAFSILSDMDHPRDEI